ncbi:MAG: helix-turn-helix domain-containing protein [Actinobacteria bacterium]|nr:helix-turn-helix domain-containing protein [Actinomycetota bacterium]
MTNIPPEGLEEEIPAARRRLASRLRELRRAAGLSQEELGERSGWGQSKTTKTETGKTVPQLADVEAWLRAVAAPAEVRDELRDLAEVALSATSSWKREHSRGLRRNQLRYARMEQAASTIRIYQPGIVPGLLQVGPYARRVMALGNPSGQVDLDDAVGARMARQDILYDEGKRFEFIVTEATLRWRPGPPQLLLAQLDRLVSVSTLPNVEIGIIPLGVEAVALPHHSFVVYGEPEVDDEVLVIIETLAGELTERDNDTVQLYLERFTRYRAAAVFGADARAVLSRVAAETNGFVDQ